MSASDQALECADEIIQLLKENAAGDFSAFREQIAIDIYDKGLWSGHWDSSFNPDEYLDNCDLVGFRVIQEDEYDQSMSDDEKPDWDDMMGEVPHGYLWADC